MMKTTVKMQMKMIVGLMEKEMRVRAVKHKAVKIRVRVMKHGAVKKEFLMTLVRMKGGFMKEE
jgi:hypothetical protein